MFLDLIKLYNKQKDSGRIPLEDFNTECFANILKLYPEIKQDFIINFLNLPIDDYDVSTQLRRDLEDTQNCIIDLVLIGKSNACLIECKVESSEGWEQLFRYGKVLEIYYSEKNKYLIYLTQYSDIKNQDGQYDKFNFNQYRWYHIAKFLKKYGTENPLINDYLKFLKTYNMAQDNTLKSVNLIAMENMKKTIEICEFHIENAKQHFKKMFGSANPNANFNWSQIRQHRRISHYNGGIVKSASNKHSEILYSIQLSKLQLNVHIYLTNEHELIHNFNNLIFNPEIFTLTVFEHGSSIVIVEDLGSFLNDENADKNINDWFNQSFGYMKDLMEQNPKIEWNLQKPI